MLKWSRRTEAGDRSGYDYVLFRDLSSVIVPPVLRRSVWIATALLLALLFAGGAVSRSIPTRAHIIKTAGALPYFNFLTWELEAIGRMILFWPDFSCT